MIYLDTNIIIYAIENQPRYGGVCKKILSDIESGKLKVCASILVLAEVLNVLVKINKLLQAEGKKQLDIRKNIDAILSLPLTWFDLSFFVLKKAAEYDYLTSGVDYVHIASMELNSVVSILSADEELKKVGNIKRIDPLQYS